jgi:type I restriction enzyme M protein
MSEKSSGRKNGDLEHRRQEVQQAVKNACDQLRSEGVDARNYVEQLAWMFFLKAFDEAEARLESEAEFGDKQYTRRLDGKYRWSKWSEMKDHDAMLDFVDGRTEGKLWHKLENLGEDAMGQRFARIFSSVRNYCRRGSSFARVVGQVNRLHFSDETDVIVLSELYEGLLKDVAADSAGYAGEFYTQRHIIRAMVEVVRPKLGDKVYDPCFGTAGFLGEAAEYIRRHHRTMNAKDLARLQQQTFYGFELKPLTYLLGTMNMLLHRIEGANLELTNTLEVHSANTPEKNKYDVILANPPYGGKMAQELQTNFTIRSGSTQVLFLQHIMANLAKGGRAGVILPEGVVFRGGPDAKVRKKLIEEFRVHTVLSLPAKCFLPYTGVKTNVIFFDRPTDGSVTDKVWFYDLTNDGFELKTTRKPIPGEQISDFMGKWESQKKGENSWCVSVKELAKREYDLSARNPNRRDDYEHRPAIELVQSIKLKEERIVGLLAELEEMLGEPS